MSVRSSKPKEYEVTDRDQIVPVASPQYLLSEILERLVAVEEENRQLRARLEELEDFTARERALDRQRIQKLEDPAPALREETASAHLDRLFSEMRRLSIRQVTTKDAAHLLGISKRQMKDVKPYLADDSRFVVMKDPHHKQRHLIRLV